MAFAAPASGDPSSCPRLEEAEIGASGGPTGEDFADHLAACDQCSSAWKRVQVAARDIAGAFAWNKRDAPLAEDRDAASDVGVPADLVPGYRIVAQLGEGTFGAVYRAVQEATKRDVAIKLLRSGRFATIEWPSHE